MQREREPHTIVLLRLGIESKDSDLDITAL